MKTKHYIFILVLIGFLVYGNVLFNKPVWDDEEFFRAGLNSMKGTYFRPIITTLFSFLYAITGSQAFFFHLFQITFHIINSILIFVLFSYLLGSSYLWPFMMALIFLIHPVNVEAVSFIAATQEVLFFTFGTSGLLLMVKKRFSNLVPIFFLGSLLVKETGIVFFILTFFYLALYNKKFLKKYALFSLLLIMIYGFVRLLVHSTYVQGKGLFPIMRVGLVERLQTTPSIIVYYLSKFFWPRDLAIAQHWVVKNPGMNNFILPLTAIIIALTVALLYFAKTKNKLFLFFLFWLIVGLAPHLQIIPLNMTAAERWFYFPMVGLLGMLGIILSKLKHQKAIIILLVSVIMVLSIRTIIRTFDWRDELSLFGHDIKYSTNAFDIQNNLGVALFRTGRVEESGIYFRKSVELAPYWWVNWNNLGAYYEHKKDLAKAEEYYAKSISNGDYYLAYENYAMILIKEKKLKEAKDFLENKALGKFPKDQRLIQIYRYLLTN